MSAPEIKEMFFELLEEIQEEMLDKYLPEGVHPDDWNLKGLESEIGRRYLIAKNFSRQDNGSPTPDEIADKMAAAFQEAYERKEKDVEQVVERIQDHPPQLMDRIFGKERNLEGFIRQRMLETLDRHWMDNLYAMDHLKEGIGLRGYAQKNPLHEYKREGFEIFSEMMENFHQESAEAVFRATFVEKRQDAPKPVIRSMEEGEQPAQAMDHGYDPDAIQTNTSEGDTKRKPFRRGGEKVGRNDPCPCGAVDGSGKPLKYKKCCGR
jgi:preprotein translocase subunit SecA